MVSCVAFLQCILSYEVLCSQLRLIRYSRALTGRFFEGAQYFAVCLSEDSSFSLDWPYCKKEAFWVNFFITEQFFNPVFSFIPATKLNVVDRVLFYAKFDPRWMGRRRAGPSASHRFHPLSPFCGIPAFRVQNLPRYTRKDWVISPYVLSLRGLPHPPTCVFVNAQVAWMQVAWIPASRIQAYV
jgi:hypothetical protein